ncbi:MAG: hypothetical protein MI757_15735, partial [Pirellulales bacterium]|nr:hypothetical protein [Pirellulales bacterium]
MATRIFRVDLSDDADDFQHIALEPGLPLIDQANVNSQILFKWCGDLVAAPQLEGESVNYYVRNPEQGRLSGVTAYPATEKDLAGPLKEEVEELQRLLRKAKPETSTEQAVYATAKATLKKLTDEGASSLARQSAFYKYRHEKGPWRLVWCWGFQRKETQPAPTSICRNPQCNLLFLNRPGMKSRCPDCQQFSRRKKAPSRLVGALPLLLLLLIAAGVAFYFLNQPRLVVVPSSDISVPAGSRVQFVVHRKTLFSDEDVSGQVTVLSNNTRVLAFLPGTLEASAKSRGQSLVHFVLGGIATDASVTVEPRGNPTELFFEPADVEVGVGATHRVKVMGRYDDGDFDLTDVARFEPADTSLIHMNGPLVQGTAEGETKVRAIFRSATDSQAVEATATVSVVPRNFKSLAISVTPASLA